MYYSISDLSLKFCPDKVTFRNVAPAGLIHSLKGEYTLSERGPNLTNVHFVVVADTRGIHIFIIFPCDFRKTFV